MLQASTYYTDSPKHYITTYAAPTYTTPQLYLPQPTTYYTAARKYYTITNAAPTYHTSTCDYTEAPKYYTTTPLLMLLLQTAPGRQNTNTQFMLLRLTTPKVPSSITLPKAARATNAPECYIKRKGNTLHYTTSYAALTHYTEASKN
jgi:hypothetical protein